MNPVKLLGCTLVTVFLAIFALFSLLFWLPIRLCVQLLAKVFRKDLDGMIDPARAFVYRENLHEKPEFNITCYIVYDGHISVDLARQLYRERIGHELVTNPSSKLEFHRLRTSLTTFCGYSFWKREKEFKIENHIHAYKDLVQDDDFGTYEGEKLPIKAVYVEQDLKTIASYMATRKWKRGQSPWEAIVLNNFQSAGTSKSEGGGESSTLQTVLVFRIHHVLGDGYSLMNLFAKSHGYQGEFCAIPAFPKRGVWIQLLYAISLPVRAFWDMVIMLYRRGADQNEWIDAPRDGQLSSSYITTWSPAIPLERIKTLKNRFDVSFFAVLQSVSAGVLAKMMRSAGAEVPALLRCFVPMPLPNHPLGLRIHAFSVKVELLTGEVDPVDRLMKSHKSTLRLTDSIAPLVLSRLILILCLAPNVFISLVAKISGITLGFSPFPGFGSRMQATPEHVVRRFFFQVGLPPAATPVCNLTSFTSCGNVVFTFSSRRHIINSRKEVEQFSEFLEEELCALEKAV